MTDNQTGSKTAKPEGAPGSHSELFGLQGQKRASTTAGAGAGGGIIGTSGHAGAANKGVDLGSRSDIQNAGVAGVAEGGKSSTITGSGGETLTPSQGSGDVRSAGEEKGVFDKLNPLKRE
ncbi:uncharacterized protein A1O5_04650 [Cladophialophora psammophila CBS 110553]|uniref:Uncharacterized protein n=1 Tax=Cladophialophora psammophila CBS 110553 TaxID=1182543 RepID=W9X5E3_9EURO|nr:uncharacterized protein A1O5_04650 [Cladophialophora psammophila CBS 110553]EXJ72146.1 hypothetical protein A1O5_04650 [Cladophialophora psammophila CBS 110553]